MASGPATLKRRSARAVIALAALYALALQAFLGGMMPLPSAADGICAAHAQAGGPTDKAVPHDHGACCTAAQVGAAALPPRAGPSPVSWPARVGTGVAWMRLAPPQARAPPGRIAPPRGPPVA